MDTCWSKWLSTGFGHLVRRKDSLFKLPDSRNRDVQVGIVGSSPILVGGPYPGEDVRVFGVQVGAIEVAAQCQSFWDPRDGKPPHALAICGKSNLCPPKAITVGLHYASNGVPFA